MLMNIKNILNVPGTSQAIQLTVSEERLADVHGYVFHSPVRAEGSIANHAGMVLLKLHITCSLLVTCDRCLRETIQDFDYSEEHVVVRSLESEEDEEDYILARAESIDPVEIVITDLLLELPTKMLCRADCKGLCPVCGCDRNETDCGCDKQ